MGIITTEEMACMKACAAAASALDDILVRIEKASNDKALDEVEKSAVFTACLQDAWLLGSRSTVKMLEDTRRIKRVVD